MRIPSFITVLCLAAAFTLSVAIAGSHTESTKSVTDQESHEQRYQVDVSSGQLLEIRLDTGAGLSIIGWDKNQAVVVTKWRETKCPDARVDVHGTPRGVSVASTYDPDTGDTHNCSMEIEIHVPHKFSVQVRSAGGGIKIVDLTGTIEGHTGGGNLKLERVRGKAELRTGGGPIEVKDADLEGQLETGGGHVSLVNVTGPIRASSGSERTVKHGQPRSQ